MSIHQHFGPCGNVTDIHFDEDRETGEFKRSARVSFSSISGVEAAVALHGTRIEGTCARFNVEPLVWESVCEGGQCRHLWRLSASCDQSSSMQLQERTF